MKSKFIAIEGNIGAGKTSLANKIAKDYNSELILESFSNNPFLPKFYKDPEKHAFSLELFFMSERYHQLKKTWSRDLFFSNKISDYFFMKSKIFAKTTLKDDELVLFDKLFEIMLSSLPFPDLLVYIHSDIKRLQEVVSNDLLKEKLIIWLEDNSEVKEITTKSSKTTKTTKTATKTTKSTKTTKTQNKKEKK